MSVQSKRPNRVVYTFPDIGRPTLDLVNAGRAPRERLFGAVQLSERGWQVRVCDAQWTGLWGVLNRMLSRFTELPSFALLRSARWARIVVIQGRVAPVVQAVLAIMGVRIVYVDVMFEVPKRAVRRWLQVICMRQAGAVIGYSHSQMSEWAASLDVRKARLLVANYPMDSGFYRAVGEDSASPVPIIAVGRDRGRDFGTLVAAAQMLQMSINLVTLDYLVPENARDAKDVQIHQRLSYEELFALYSRSTVAVVPLEGGISYPSGIRAVLEAMLLKVAVVATWTPVLAEHFDDGVHVLYVPPGDPATLASALSRLAGDAALRARLASNAYELVTRNFGVDQFADTMELAIRSASSAL